MLESLKTRLERAKNTPLFWAFFCFLLIIILSYGEIIKEEGIPYFLQCSLDEHSPTNGEKTNSGLTLHERTSEGSDAEEKHANTSIWCSLISHVSSNILEALYHAISFAFLVLVFGIFYMDEVTKTVKLGFGTIGTTVADTAQPITTSAVDALEKLAAAADAVKIVANDIPKPHPPIADETKASPEIGELLEKTEKEVLVCIEEGDFKGAEKKWIDVIEQHPSNIEIVEYLISFYDKYSDQFTKERVLKTILPLELSFKDDAHFYGILANIYTGLRTSEKDIEYKNKAISAALKSIELDENNPKWLALLGSVNYWFNDVQQAIYNTNNAVTMAENNACPVNREEHDRFIMDCKNNLSYFYALERISEETAFEYAKMVFDFYESEIDVCKSEKELAKAKIRMAMSTDGLGYVILRFSKAKEDVEKALSYFDRAARIMPREKFILQHIEEAYCELEKFSRLDLTPRKK